MFPPHGTPNSCHKHDIFGMDFDMPVYATRPGQTHELCDEIHGIYHCYINISVTGRDSLNTRVKTSYHATLRHFIFSHSEKSQDVRGTLALFKGDLDSAVAILFSRIQKNLKTWDSRHFQR